MKSGCGIASQDMCGRTQVTELKVRRAGTSHRDTGETIWY